MTHYSVKSPEELQREREVRHETRQWLYATLITVLITCLAIWLKG